MTTIFVYGTLRRGQGLAHVLGNSSFKGMDALQGYEMWNLGTYPGIVAGEGQVVGEIYSVSQPILRRLDEIEGVPHLYKRRHVTLKGGGDADTYVYAHNIIPGRHVIIPSGDWLQRNAA